MRRVILLIAVVTVSAGLLVGSVAAQDLWSHRGRTAARNGLAGGAPPDITTPRFVASAAGHELVGQTAPVVADGRIFVHAVAEVPDGAGGTMWVREVLAFSETDGSLLWDRAVGEMLLFDSRCSPTVDAARGHVLIGAEYNVTAMDMVTGAVVWQTTVDPWPIANSTVCVHGDQAFVVDYTGMAAGATLYALNLDPAHAELDPGEVAWIAPLTASAGCEASVDVGGTGMLVVTDSGGYLRQYAPDGTPGWVFTLPGAPFVGMPPAGSVGHFTGGAAVADGRVYAATYEYKGYQDSARLYCINAATGEKVWDVASERTSALPVVTDSLVVLSAGLNGYGSVRKVEAFDKADGTKQWEWTGGGGWTVFPVVVGHVLYVGKLPEGGFFFGPCTDLYALDLTKAPGDDGFEVGHFVGAGSSPAYANGNLYTIGDAGLYAFGPPPAGLTVTGWESLAAHGPAGEVSREVADNATEPRGAGLTKLRIAFSDAIDSDTLVEGAITITDHAGIDESGFIDTLTLDGTGTVLTVTMLDPLDDAEVYTIAVTGVLKSTGGASATGDTDLVLKVLAGDVDGSGAVAPADILAVRGHAGQGAAAAAACDVDVSGTVTGADMLAVRARLGHTLP